MHLLSVFLFAVSCNLDSLVLGILYGVRGIHIRARANLLIGFITFLGTVVSMTLGKSLLPLLPPFFAQSLGSAIIILIGAYGLLHYFLQRRGSGNQPSQQKSAPTLKTREAAALGLALSVNNIGLGIGASIAGLGVLTTSICSLLSALVFLWIGNLAGKRFISGVVGRYAEVIASLIMVFLGVYELIV